MRRPAVFLDRDGTILTERGYLTDPRRMRFYDGAFTAMRRLSAAGFALVIVTNQSGVGRGYLTLARLAEIHRRFLGLCRKKGVKIAGIYFCPHLPDAGCACRKPNPGMPRRAARDLGLDLRRSFVVGDQARDVELARAVGATGLLVLTGSGRVSRKKVVQAGGRVTSNLDSASRLIVKLMPRQRIK